MTGKHQLVPKIFWAVIALILLRMLCSWLLGSRWALFAQPEVAAYLLTEPATDPVAAPVVTPPFTTAPEEPTQTTEPVTQPSEPEVILPAIVMPEVPVNGYSFEESDVSFVEMNYSAKRTPDIEGLLTRSLDWDLTSDEPSVLIFHTHGTEAFTPCEDHSYEEVGGAYRTTDDQCNMLALGDELARLLNEAGIYAVQDRTYYDYPDYTISYDTARTGLQEQLKKYPTVKLVIDLHRDSDELSDGTQWATKAVINGEKSAQVMLVMGTDTYYTHPEWETNLSIALKLQAIMEKNHEGSTRPLDLRRQRFNQDLSSGAIIAEIGAAGNTYEEARNGVSALAEAIIMLAKGAN